MESPPPRPTGPRPLTMWSAVFLMSVSQFIGYGTIIYAYTLIAPSLAADFGVDGSLPFLVLSAALLLSGLAGPMVGRLIDRRGALNAMTAGSIAVVAAYLFLSIAPSFWTVAILVVVVQVLGAVVLYGGAFPALAELGGASARQAITLVTLVTGVSSTLFWPLTAWLVESGGWRWTFVVFAILHGVLVLPAHQAMRFRQRQAPGGAAAAVNAAPHPAGRSRRTAFWLVAISFALTAAVSSALVTHLPHILELAGVGSAAALVSMLVGPAIVASRLGEALLRRGGHPLPAAIIGALCFPAAVAMLLLGLPALVAGSLFAVLYGIGHGLTIVAGGTLPLALFGRAGYGELLGRINAVRVIFSSTAPALFALSVTGTGLPVTLAVGMAIGLAGVVPLVILQRLLARETAASAAPAAAERPAE